MVSTGQAGNSASIGSLIVQGLYGEPTNPIFTVFWLKGAHAAIADFSGRPPREFAL